MTSTKPDTDSDAPTLSAEWFAKALPAAQVLPAQVMAAARRKPGRPKARVTKEPVNIRLSADVLAAFRATGSGWQTRIDAALRSLIAAAPGTDRAPTPAELDAGVLVLTGGPKAVRAALAARRGPSKAKAK